MKIIRLVLLALTLTYSVAKADIVLVPDFRVDQDPTPNQASDMSSSLAFNYFVVSYSYSGVPPKCYARRFDLNGNPLGNAFQVNPSGGCSGARTTIDTNGNMVFTYPCFPGGLQHVCGRRFDINEIPLDAGAQLDQSADIASGGAIKSLSGGGFVVGYAQRTAGEWDTYARIYDSSGNPVGNGFRIDQNPNIDINYGWSSTSMVAASSAGRIYFAWVDARNTGSSSSRDIYARIFDSFGNPLGNDFRVTTASNVLSGGPSIAAAPDGNFIVGWSDYRNDPFLLNDDVFARAFDTNGTPFGNDFQVNSITPAGGGSVACAPSDRCLILIAENGHWFGRHLSSNGSLLDVEYQIDSGIPAYDAFTSVAGVNSFVTAWGDKRTGNYQVWANITGPLDGNGIPILSPKALIALTIILLVVVMVRTSQLRRRIYLPMILLFFYLLYVPSAIGDSMCNGGLPTPENHFPCACNGIPYNELPPGAVSMFLVHGDDSQALDRLNIFLVGEGWTESEQDNFNEQVKSFVESLKINPTYAAYFNYMNFYRVNVKSPQSGSDVQMPPASNAMYGEGPTHNMVYDDEDIMVFSTTGNWQFAPSTGAYEGRGFHIAPANQHDVSATWRFQFPDAGIPPGTIYVGASWIGMSGNGFVKYTVRKNGQILNANIIKDQRVGLGKFMEQGNNDILMLSGVSAGDIIERESRDSHPFWRLGGRG